MERYSQLCPVIFGEGSISQTGQEVKNLGCSKVMIVSDEFMAKSDIYSVCKKSLIDAELSIIEFTKVLPNPPDYIVNEGGAIARKEGVDGIVAIGGGSPMDAAKAINILINNDPPINQYFQDPFYTPGVPVIMIPTTAGTGSESTFISVLTDTTNDVKNSVLGAASLAILDPLATVTMPPHITAQTALDAFTHAAESITTKDSVTKSEVLCADAIKRIMINLPIAMKEPNNIEARGNLLLASNFAGIAFNDAIVHLGHAIGHSLGAKFHVTHGHVCALALPEVMKYAASVIPQKVNIVGEAMGIQFNGRESGTEIGEIVANEIRNLLKSLNFVSLKDLDMTRDDVLNTASMITEDPTYQYIPKELTLDEIRDILAAIYDNY
ncbi:iron-containing alcohol dehydrogenase [Alkalibaculum sp. M08DMB]|uniref:Iron-containing alcohol dehydrogenase n=1 Tax=Alkalibaculum sporogenes TaxID=2655001 RepID=A0A6A7KDR3_9FIRM|nr:iron-containing alcohol dehydrogenase [Alkalibaculum sporogenes]MPW27163.1 iron-containing alcohol dehydrogenase [Alkalibaculum sporogenes]